MNHSRRILAIIGSYRKGGVIDTATEEVLSAAALNNKRTKIKKIYLTDQNVEFCTNCRSCTGHPGESRGECILGDDMDTILGEIERSDTVLLASPVNFGTVTAVMKRFTERLICYAYWPRGAGGPKPRTRRKSRRAVIIVSSAAPSLLTRFSTCAAKPLKTAAKLLGAGKTDIMYIGLAAGEERPALSSRVKQKARRIGKDIS
ncbi:MAG: flavodoxin family protein [Desulfobacteraceae bacterium]